MAEDTTTKIGEHTYSIGRLTPKQQFHIARRLAPVLSGVTAAFREAVENNKGETDALSIALPPLTEVISKMSDDETDYIVDKCLSVCKRQTEQGTWARVATPSGAIMFQDLELDAMLGLTIAVIKENLGNFFPTEAQPSPAEAGGHQTS